MAYAAGGIMMKKVIALLISFVSLMLTAVSASAADVCAVAANEAVPLWYLPASVIAGFVLGFIIIGSIAAKNKSVRRQDNASVYTREGSMTVSDSADIFLYKNVECRAKPKQNDNS